jgi:hypothetical protein
MEQRTTTSSTPTGCGIEGARWASASTAIRPFLSVQASFQDSNYWSYEFSYRHAAISNPQNLAGNVVTAAPAHINMAEARLGFPLRHVHLDLAVRVQDDQPRPERGFWASVEALLSYRL